MFSHDVEFALSLVVDLVNTDPAATGSDLMPNVATLSKFVGDHGISDVGTLTESDLKVVKALRPRMREVFSATDTAAAAALVNGLLKGSHVSPRLTNHDDYAWHMHYFVPGSTIADHLLTDGGMALSFVVVAGEHERLQVCDAPDCDRVLVDLSRNRSKRYCDSRTCGNRLHVAAYRQRQREASAAAP